MSGLERIGDEVARELGRFPPVAGMAAIVAAWPEVVGETIARNAWPARLARDGTLHVAASSSAWAFELTHLEAEMRARLIAAAGAEAGMTRLRFAPGRLPEPPSATSDSAPPAPLAVDADSAAEAERLAAAVGDEKLRKIVAKAAAASLARAATGRPF